MYNYIINRFGKEKTAYILASGTCVDKGTIDIIGKGLRAKWKQERGIKITDKKHDDDNPYNLVNIDAIKTEYESDAEATKKAYPDIFYYFDGLVNTVISQSQHPAGIVASPINLINNYSMFVGEDGQYILPINMEEVHEIGLVKYDILGLKNIGIIKKACEYANIPYPKAHEINWNDEAVYKDMVKSPIGIFQFESPFAFELLRRFGVHTINDMSLVNASLRPSGESYRDRLIAHEPNKNPSELIDKLLEPNHGYLVFQEDVIAFLQQICGLSGSEADNVRRAIGRKQMDRLQKALPSILEGYCKMSDKPRDVAEEEAKTFLKIIEDASSYMFGYNHSTGYSMLGYLCAYMRYYFPKEFVCAFLNCSKSDEDILNGTLLATQRNIIIKPPIFRQSLNEFTCDEKANIVYKGLGSIKNIGKNNGAELYALKDNKYQDFFELLADIKDKTTVNSKQLDILIKLNFFQEFGTINQLLSAVELYNKFGTRKSISKNKLEETEFIIVQKHSRRETPKQFNDIDNMAIVKALYKQVIPINDVYLQARYQATLLGYCDIKVPNSPYCVVVNIAENKWGNVFANLYCLASGRTKQFKCNKKYYKEFGLNVGDIIKIAIDAEEKKTRASNGTWVSTGEYQPILQAWSCKK